MPLSLTNAAQRWVIEDFLAWNPATDVFSPWCKARLKRIDSFTSLWSKSSRRHNGFIVPGTDLTGVFLVRHPTSGLDLLLSRTSEQDDWDNTGIYNQMVRLHKATSPSGGKGAFQAMRVQGSGDDLGPVIQASDAPIYLDVERSGETRPDETVNAVEGIEFVYMTANVSPQEGDFVTLAGQSYRLDNVFWDAGFLAAKATNISPTYQTVTFSFPGASSPVFDPSTGEMTGGTYQSRQVSAQMDALEVVGPTAGPGLSEKRTLYIYNKHIGFDPLPGQQVSIEGRSYRVTRVDNNVEELQWKVEVEP